MKEPEHAAKKINVSGVIRGLLLTCLLLCCCSSVDAETLPVLAKATFQANFQEYRVKPGDTLSTLSQRFRTSVNALKMINNIHSDEIRSGKTLRYPSVGVVVSLDSHTNEILGYRIYAAKYSLYLLAIIRTNQEEDWKHVFLFKKSGDKWVLTDSLIYLDYLGADNRAEPHARDIDKDGNDECYIIGEYPCSAKDLCYSAYFQVPQVSQKIYGVSIITYAPNAATAELTGPFLSIYEEEIGEGEGSDSRLDKYKQYILGKARGMLDKSLRQ